MSFPTPLSFSLGPLSHPIDPRRGMSSHRVLGTKIEIKLAKARKTEHWNVLEGQEDDGKARAAAVGHDSQSSAPITDPPPIALPSGTTAITTPKKTSTNWDALARSWDDEEEQEKERRAQDPNAGDSALNELFQQIYRDADPDTRRAMIKSYQESGGTALSTNWDEVGKKKVEVSPPQGLIAKKWDN